MFSDSGKHAGVSIGGVFRRNKKGDTLEGITFPLAIGEA